MACKLNSTLREGESRMEREKKTENKLNGRGKKGKNQILQVMLLIALKNHTEDIAAIKIWKKNNRSGIELPIQQTNMLV